MSTLHDRLDRVADQADTGAPSGVAPHELWQRGRSYGRRRRAAGAVLAGASVLALVLVCVVTLGSLQPPTVEPADAPGGLRLPDRLYRPDPWARGTDETGPVGPVVAVLGAPRSSWGDLGEREAVAAVTASGEYAFLDLDDRVGDVVSPSPDGRYVAYWFTDGRAGLDVGDGTPAAAGIAVLDTVSGRVRRHLVDAPLGLMTEDVLWSGDRLWVPVWEYDERVTTDDTASASSSLQTILVLDPSGAEISDQDPRGLVDLGQASSTAEGLVLRRADRILLLGTDGERAPVARVEGRFDGPASLGPTGSRLALLRNTDRRGDSNQPEPLLVGDLPADAAAPVSFRELPGPRVDRIVGWRSGDEVVTYRYDDTGALYEAVDVTTGERRVLLRSSADRWGPGERLAQDALAAPTFQASPPPTVRDPRLVLGAGVGLVVALTVLGTFLWRRRVRG